MSTYCLQTYIKMISLFLIPIFIFSGCSLNSGENYPDILLTTVGTIAQEEDSFFSSYILTSNESIPQIKIDSSSDIFEKNLGESIIVKGFFSSENFLHSSSNIPTLKVIDTLLIDSSWRFELFELFNFSLQFPKNITREETKESIIFTKDNDIFFVILKNEFKDWDKKLQTKGNPIEEITINKQAFFRQKSGKIFLFYYPKKNIQIDFYGDSLDLPLFYTIIESLQFENISFQKNKFDTADNSPPIVPDIPPVRVIISELLNKKNDIITSPEPFYIERIDILDSFVSVEYREQKSKKVYKIIWAIEWKSLFLEEISFQFLASFEQGEKMRWNITKGSIPNIEKKYSFFLQNLSEKYTPKRPKNFIWYISPQYQFTIGYPEKMYYAHFQKDDTILENIGWGIALLQEGDTPEISLKIIKGKKDERLELFSENKILIPKSETAHFELSSKNPSSSFSILQQMADTLQLHK